MLSRRHERYLKPNIETPLNSDNLYAYGTARKDGPVAISFYSGAGALWYNKKVRLHPRFEVQLQVSINEYDCIPNNTIDGFTVILSKTPNYLNGAGGYLGYFNIFDAVVLEVDLFQNIEFGDSGANTLSLHRCFKSKCTPNENRDTVQRSLPYVIKFNISHTIHAL